MSFWAIKVICFENHQYEGWIVRDPIQYIWETLIGFESNYGTVYRLRLIYIIYYWILSEIIGLHYIYYILTKCASTRHKFYDCFNKIIVVGNSLPGKI